MATLPETGFTAASGLRVQVATAITEEDAPLITCGTDWGFACGKEALERYVLGRHLRSVRRVVQDMAAYDSGPLISFVDRPASRRALALVQADNGGLFYERHHRAWLGVWRDFYYAATVIALREIDRRWRAETVHIEHPTHVGWRKNTSAVMLEAAQQLHVAGAVSALRRLVFIPCGPLPIDQLRGESQSVEQENARYRPLAITPVLGISRSEHITILGTTLDRLNPLPKPDQDAQ